MAQPAREIAVPMSVFAVLRRELGKEAGPLPTIHALHTAGYAAGSGSAAAFSNGSDVLSLSEEAFWTRVSGFFSRRGWGALTYKPAGEALGFLSSPDWAESMEIEGDGQASCSFSAGFLSGLLSEISGGPIAVLEVTCRGRGDGVCTFAFGAEAAIHELYGRLLEDTDLEKALAGL